MLATIIFAIEHSANHGDKSAFYIAGAVLAGWAVIVGALGVLRPAVTDGDVSHRAIMGVTVVLAAVTMAMAIVTAS
jgi:hypothetical protein